jgi:hypothetical protein
MFDRARALRVHAIPLLRLRDLLVADPAAYNAIIDRDANLQFGFVISSSELSDLTQIEKALGVLEQIDLTPERCLVIADFHDADLSLPEIVAPIISGALQDLQSAAPWQQIVFQGTNFPETNPATPGAHHLVPRNEWAAWRQAVKFDPETADHLIFGDYAADCAKLKFGGSGGAAIRHYRYTTADAWLVQRGSDQGTHEATMRQVCREIVNSGLFAGRAFSSADDYIFRTAEEVGGPGNAKDWRGVNTTHHLTRVVTDIGSIRGVSFAPKSVEPLGRQVELFA